MSTAAPPARPSVTLKLATSLDGRIATASGESQWITGVLARAAGHKLRSEHGAVLVGSGTVLADDPELTVRSNPPVAVQPLRIVADSRTRTPPTAKLFLTVDKGPVAFATLETANLDHWPSTRGLQFWMLPPDPVTGSLSLPDLLDSAARAGVKTLMVEGGGEIAAAFVRAGLVDRIEWFRAPVLLGGDGRACLGGLGLAKLLEAPTYTRTGLRELGPDVWESYERKA